MAKKSMILKQQAPAKFSTRKYNRCKLCGRPHAYLRDYGVCRICFRTLAYKGEIPGVRKASWQSFSAILRWCGSTYTKYAAASPPRLAKKSWIYLMRSWHGLLCAKHSGTLLPRMTKESIPLYTAGGRAAQVRRRCR